MGQEIDLSENIYSSYFKERKDYHYLKVEQEFGQEVVDYISQYADFVDPGTTLLATDEVFNIDLICPNKLNSLINLKRFNDIKQPDRFFYLTNTKLPQGGLFIGCVETLGSRKQRILNKFPRAIAYPYYFLDFILKRVFPKWGPTRRIYRVLTRGENRAMSQTEALGRLAAAGFEVVDTQKIGFLTFIVSRKIETPLNRSFKQYGLIIGLDRIGKDGELFKVYKFRTMHPYAEYIQNYVYQNGNIQDGGKFKGDFRVTYWGRIMRKLWIDEQPMWLNWLKREMKLVGVRPLSEHYFSLYPEELRQRRIKYKPGLIPPFYADLPKTFEEIVTSELKYLDAYERNPWKTDFKYFWMAVYNILFTKARSN